MCREFELGHDLCSAYSKQWRGGCTSEGADSNDADDNDRQRRSTMTNDDGYRQPTTTNDTE
ncbi:hypothetical protein BDN70DRAFT_872917 [Pholiota conissans]|uniref:Uncharacterized protein n=1 Tax=Pholiota conissans TaxID=109636 RepID=A0A9P5ZBN4_9AGAR|nr:hypothetical protein BDN70DRAFT_872917 [Pholiota conissans]